MTGIQPFTFPTTGQTVRTVVIDDEVFFVAKDACDVVGISKYRDAVAQLDEDERMSAVVDTPGGLQCMSVVNEPGVYALMMISRSPQVKPFRRWVMHEVLPTIRQTGSYSLPTHAPDELELAERTVQLIKEKRLALARAEEAENRAALAEIQTAELAPAARAWDELMEAHGDFDVAQAAQILARDPSIRTGRDRLFEYMDAIGWTYKHGKQPRRAYQAQVDLDRLRMAPTHFDHPRTGERTLGAPKVMVTVKGLFELHKRLGGTAQLPALVSEQVAA